MSLDPIILDMLGPPLRAAVEEARGRLTDDTVMARCEEALWQVERGGDVIAAGLTYEDAIDTLEALI